MQQGNRLSDYKVTRQLTVMKDAFLRMVMQDASVWKFIDKGIMRFPANSKVFRNWPTPQTATDTATLTAAQMLGSLLVGTPTAAATYTTLTGTLLLAALPANILTDDSFDLVITNLGTTTRDITLAGGTDVTIVGDTKVRPVADADTEQGGTGVFRITYRGGVTFVIYRVN